MASLIGKAKKDKSVVYCDGVLTQELRFKKRIHNFKINKAVERYNNDYFHILREQGGEFTQIVLGTNEMDYMINSKSWAIDDDRGDIG